MESTIMPFVFSIFDKLYNTAQLLYSAFSMNVLELTGLTPDDFGYQLLEPLFDFTLIEVLLGGALLAIIGYLVVRFVAPFI